jgi:hypothetical protein
LQLISPQQRAELWERWKNGQCVADIARALERRNKSGVYRILAVNGGIAPEPRRRAAGALRLEEREEISRGIAAGTKLYHIIQTEPCLQRSKFGVSTSRSDQKQTLHQSNAMSAIHPKADIRQRDQDVRFVPLTDIKSRALPLVPATARMPGDTHGGHEGY